MPEPAPALQRTLLDRGTIVIGDEIGTLYLAPDLLALKGGRESAKVDIDQVAGACVDRDFIARTPVARAGNLRLIIAGGQRTAIADLNRLEITGEEVTRTAARYIGGGLTRRLPIGTTGQPAAVGASHQTGAGQKESRTRRLRLRLGNRQGCDRRASQYAGLRCGGGTGGRDDRRCRQWRRGNDLDRAGTDARDTEPAGLNRRSVGMRTRRCRGTGRSGRIFP